MKPAIIVIDMQNDFFKEKPLKSMKTFLCENINELIADARNKKIPVIWVYVEYKPDSSDINLHDKKINMKRTIKGTYGAKMLGDLQRENNETIIIKKRYSAFFGTNFDEIIEKLELDTLILAGINTHACVRTTAVDAFQRDIEVIIAKDCIGSWDKKHHSITLKYFKKNMSIQILSNQQLKRFL